MPRGERQVSAIPTDEWAVDRASAVLPAIVDVAIIGGGIAGVSTAYFLARAGITVALCEKGRIAGEQSGRNWGWVRQQGRSSVELPLMIQSLALWRGFERELAADVGFTQGGSLYLAANEEQLDGFRPWLDVARSHELDTRILNAQELSTLLKTTGVRWVGAMYTASDGRAEPNRAAPAIARAAARAGAWIFTHCAVRGIERAAGAVHGVVTEFGTIRASSIICAAGAWTSYFCRSIDVEVPQLLVKGTVARTVPGPDVLAGEAWSHDVAIRRRRDGGYTVARGSALEHVPVTATFRYLRKFLPALRQEQGAVRLRLGWEFVDSLLAPRRRDLAQPSAFERERILAPLPDAGDLREMRRALERSFPELARLAFAETWAGMIESSPDVLPIISPADGCAGLYVVTGFSGHGFGIGPAAGRLAADMVRKKASSGELAPFRLSRFYDGSPIRPGPTI